MDATAWGVVVACAILGGTILALVLVALRFSAAARFRRALARLPLVTAATGEPPAAKIRGVVEGEATLVGPISGRPCVAYEISIQERGEDDWVVRAREQRAVEFFVRDASGRCRVRVEGAPVRVALEEHASTRGAGFVDPAFRDAFLARHRISPRHRLIRTERMLAYAEAAVLPGETVVVAGRAAREPDPDAAGGEYRDLATRLVLTGDAGFPLHITDVPDQVREGGMSCGDSAIVAIGTVGGLIVLLYWALALRGDASFPLHISDDPGRTGSHR